MQDHQAAKRRRLVGKQPQTSAGPRLIQKQKASAANVAAERVNVRIFELSGKCFDLEVPSHQTVGFLHGQFSKLHSKDPNSGFAVIHFLCGNRFLSNTDLVGDLPTLELQVLRVNPWPHLSCIGYVQCLRCASPIQPLHPQHRPECYEEHPVVEGDMILKKGSIWEKKLHDDPRRHPRTYFQLSHFDDFKFQFLPSNKGQYNYGYYLAYSPDERYAVLLYGTETDAGHTEIADWFQVKMLDGSTKAVKAYHFVNTKTFNEENANRKWVPSGLELQTVQLIAEKIPGLRYLCRSKAEKWLIGCDTCLCITKRFQEELRNKTETQYPRLPLYEMEANRHLNESDYWTR